MDYLYLVLGLGLLLAGANYLVDSSVAIAQRAKLSNFIIGLTIVGMGTSAPELFISIRSALAGMGDMAMGNVVGSNINNTLLILGATATILPFAIERENTHRDIPMAIFGAVLLFLFAYDTMLPHFDVNCISRVDAISLLVIFAIYMWFIFKSGKKVETELEENATSSFTGKPIMLLWGIAIASLACLVGGGNLFLNSAVNLAEEWGMSQSVISITIVALGTSLPELITCIVAATKGNAQLALGNVVGSNIFNIFLVIGASALICPFEVNGVTLVDYGMLILSSVLTFVVAYTFGKRRFDRIEGVIFLVLYVAYTAYLLMR